MAEQWIDTEAIAAHCGVSVKTVRRWVQTTDFPHVRPDGTGQIVSKVSLVDQWMLRHARHVDDEGNYERRSHLQKVRPAKAMR
jgi:predicted DNA-binding transcriptional regulator AlpA